jgi:hypothetical protein
MSQSVITLDSADSAIPLLDENGYALVRGVLSAEEVAQARAVFDQHLPADPGAQAEIEAATLLEAPELTFMFTERVVRTLSALLGGSLAYYPNYIGRLNRRIGWHVDNGFSPRVLADAGHVFDPGFRHLQCVVYLQDNVPGAGGGLDVRPGSHRWWTEGRMPDHDELLRRYPDVVTVDSRAGDLTVFDGRLMHRGTPADGTHTLRKYGVHWSASRADPTQMSRFLDYLASRVRLLRSTDRPPETFERDVRRLRLMRSVHFPQSYPAPVVDLARRLGVTVTELPSTAGSDHDGSGRDPGDTPHSGRERKST